MKIIKTNEKGITLIALVITIIVLLILAGITIATLTGENGLFARTKESKKSYIGAEMKEALIMALQDLQAEKLAEATLDNITQEWANDKLAQYKPIVGISTKPSGKTITMEKSGITKTFLIDGNLNIIEMENKTNILFSYETTSKDGEDVKILIKVQEKISGINRVELPDGSALNCNGIKEEKEIEYTVKIGTEYKFKIIAEDGTSREETILIEPEIEVTEAYIGTSTTETNANNSVADNSQTKGTTLYINFRATIVGTDCTVTLKNDESKTLPYEVTQNGKYIFTVKGLYKGKTYTKEIEIAVNKYQAPKGVVKYDAGDWTESELKQLMDNNQYSAKGTTDFTFGGFTYKGDTIIQSNPELVTSRNQSVKPQGATIKYDGWQILKKTTKTDKNGETIKNKDGTDRIYVQKLIHAGIPEYFNMPMWGTMDSSGYRAEYLFTGKANYGDQYKLLPNGKEIAPRNLNVYRDKTLEAKGYIQDVHFMTHEDAQEATPEMLNIGWGIYTSTPSYRINELIFVNKSGQITLIGGHSGIAGLRPIITMADDVYIESGEGTDVSPYVLGKD